MEEEIEVKVKHSDEGARVNGYRKLKNDAHKFGFSDYKCVDCGMVTTLDVVEEEIIFED